jgi:hypothetical protein
LWFVEIAFSILHIPPKFRCQLNGFQLSAASDGLWGRLEPVARKIGGTSALDPPRTFVTVRFRTIHQAYFIATAPQKRGPLHNPVLILAIHSVT